MLTLTELTETILRRTTRRLAISKYSYVMQTNTPYIILTSVKSSLLPVIEELPVEVEMTSGSSLFNNSSKRDHRKVSFEYLSLIRKETYLRFFDSSIRPKRFHRAEQSIRLHQSEYVNKYLDI